MKILVINSGSSSLKYQLFDMDNEKMLAKGNCEKIGLEDPIISYKHDGKEETFTGAKNHEEAIKKVLDILVDKDNGVILASNEETRPICSCRNMADGLTHTRNKGRTS